MRMSPVAADDNHDKKPLGDKGNDSFGGWIQIEADKLEYRTITKALEDGDYYASNGAAVRRVWVEGEYVHVDCDPAEKVVLTLGNGKCKVCRAEDGPVTHAELKMPEYATWFRVSVWDENGKFAITRAFFPEEWK